MFTKGTTTPTETETEIQWHFAVQNWKDEKLIISDKQ